MLSRDEAIDRLNEVFVVLATTNIWFVPSIAHSRSCSRSVQCAGRQYEAQRRLGCGSVARVDARAVEPPTARRGHGHLGHAVMGGNPVHNRRKVGARGENRCALDYDSTRWMRTRQSGHEGLDLKIFHSLAR